jgi:hypothetical protein
VRVHSIEGCGDGRRVIDLALHFHLPTHTVGDADGERRVKRHTISDSVVGAAQRRCDLCISVAIQNRNSRQAYSFEADMFGATSVASPNFSCCLCMPLSHRPWSAALRCT